jgi:hypothetical protein
MPDRASHLTAAVVAEGGKGFIDLAVLAINRANDAHDVVREQKAWSDAHEAICDLRQSQMRHDITELKSIVQRTAAWLLGGMAVTICTLVATLLFKAVH